MKTTTAPSNFDKFAAAYITEDMDEIDTLLATIEAGKDYFKTPAGKAEEAARQAEMDAIREERRAREAAVAAERKARECRKCSGKGYLPHYRHVDGGECFACDGTGIKNFGGPRHDSPAL